MKSFASERLLETLNWWKALSYRREILMPITHPYLVGPHTQAHITRWRNYEKMVLDNRIEYLDFREWMELDSQGENFDFLRALEQFPCELFEWNRKSRRAIHVPKGMQFLAVSGDFSRLKWSDVLWPYDSFVLTLEQPIELEDAPGHWSYFDTILVSHVTSPGNTKTLRIRLLRKPDGTMLGVFPEKRRNLLEKHLRAGDVDRAQRVLSSAVQSIVKDAGGTAQGFRSMDLYTTIPGVETVANFNDPVRIEEEDFVAAYERVSGKTATEEEQWRMGYMSLAAKLVLGWVLLMESYSQNAILNTRPATSSTRGNAGIITSPELICTILLKGRLDPSRYVETPEYERAATSFKRPHWRRGHWKRERGSPRNARKTVRVPPKLIRADLVPLFGIISGTATWMEEED